MKTIVNANALYHQQRGAASLLVAMVLLAVITLVSLTTSRTVLMEQKIAANVYRSNMAFEAAEAGMERAIAYIRNGRNPDGDLHAAGACQAGQPMLAAEVCPVDGTDISDPNEFLFDTNADGTNDSNSFTLANDATVAVTLMNRSTATTVATQITAVGRSDDNVASRTINQTIALVNPLPNVPDNPLLTRGSAVVGGAVNVVNPEGHSTIWSGGAVDMGSNPNTGTEIANPADPNYPNCLGDAANPCNTIQASSNSIAGLDIIEQDSSLSNLSTDQFFQNFFGKLPTDYRNSSVTLDITGAQINQINLVTKEVIWVEGDATINGNVTGCNVSINANAGNLFPCPTANIGPVILIINGNVTMQGTPQIYGLFYVAGDVRGAGTPHIMGSMVVAGGTAGMNGTIDIRYNSAVLGAPAEDGPPASAGGS